MSNKKKWSVKKRWGVLAGLPLAAVATTAAAAAVFAALAGVQGSGTTSTFNAEWTSPVNVDSSGATFKPSNDAKVTSGKLQLPSNLSFFAGESITIEASVKPTEAAKSGYVSGLDLDGLGTGYTAQLMTGCGAKVTGDQPAYVKIKITAPDTLEQGASWTLSGDAGVQVTPLGSYSAAAPTGVVCAPYTGQ